MASPLTHASTPVDVPEYNTQFEPGPDDNETLWNVLEIVKEDKKRYLVKWEGTDPDTGKPWDPSWVPKPDCTDDLIYEWKLTKAKKAKARKKKRTSKGDEPPDAYDPKPLTSRKGGKSRDNTGSSTSTHNSATIAGPSRQRVDVHSGKVSPVIEIIRHKKRPRESYPPDGNSETEFVTEDVPQLKKRKGVANQRDGQLSPRPSVLRDQDELDATAPSPGPRHSGNAPQHKKDRGRTSRKKQFDKHKSKPAPLEIPSPSRTLPHRAPNEAGSFESGSAHKRRKLSVLHSSRDGGKPDIDQYDSGHSDEEPLERKSMDNDVPSDQFHSSGHSVIEVEGRGFDLDDGEVPMNVDDIVPQGRDDHHSSSPSLPSPRDLLMGTRRGTDTIIAETQSSLVASEPKPRAPAHNLSLRHDHDRQEGTKQPTTTPKLKAKRDLASVPVISPADFEAYVSTARSAPPNSQTSSIDAFPSPNKSPATTKRNVMGLQREPIDSQLRNRSAYSLRQGQQCGPDNERDSALHDSIEDYEASPSDQVLQHRGIKLAEAARLRHSSLATPKPAQRLLSDIISCSLSSNLIESHEASEADIRDNGIVPDAGSYQVHGRHGLQQSEDLENDVMYSPSQSPKGFSARHRRASSKERDGSALHSIDNVGEGQRELARDGTDELGPDDALDTHEPPRPTNIFSSLEFNNSLEANAALTQRSTPRLRAIASPVRELNHALGLLNRKSEEIELLKVALKNQQSRTAELSGELHRLKIDLDEANDRYDEVNIALSQERIAKMSQEDRAVASTADDLTASSLSFVHLDRFKDTLQENEQLKLAKVQLESDVDMLRNLYTQASDAHQARVVEIGTLKRDNDSLREQATTGIKQVQMFWTTQTHKLETELTRSTGTIELLTGQARRMDDVRMRAALLPMAQKAAEAAKQEAEDWQSRFMDLGRENTSLRLEVKKWEDEAMTRRKNEQEVKEQESTMEDELVWMCPWMDSQRSTRCGALLKSREKLREHVHEHI